MRKKLQKHKFEILYFFKNAPLAILTSSLPGFVNYAIILFLTGFYSFEDVGHYRLLMSYYVLMGLFSLQESSKIQVRASAAQDRETSAALFLSRFYAIGLATLVILGLYLFQMMDEGVKLLPPGLFPLAIIACLTYPADLFLSFLQAEKRFLLLAAISFCKFALAMLMFFALMFLGFSVETATLVQIGIMGAFNIIFFCAWPGIEIFKYARKFLNPFGLVRNGNVRESFTLSLANYLPGTLEHIDKMVIGYFFGLEALGLYTLAFSTGRFIYNALKPAFYIYYRHFVERLPGKKLLFAVMIVFTLLGACLSAVFTACMHFVPFFAKFQGSEPVVYILFLSYGIAMADAIYTQSYGINKKAKSHHILVANTAISLICLAMFSSCAVLPVSAALIACALHYPIRHAGTIFLLMLLKRQERT